MLAVAAGAAPLAVAKPIPMMAEPLNPRSSDKPNPARRSAVLVANMSFRFRLIDQSRLGRLPEGELLFAFSNQLI
jgi:hypothetical protein